MSLECVLEKDRPPWEKWEIELLKELKKFRSDLPLWECISDLFPNRTLSECLQQGEVLKIESNLENEHALENSSGKNLANLPTGIDLIPLIPFAKICSFLSAEQVFGTLPKVCRHYRLLTLGNCFEVASATVNLGRSGCAKAVMLRKKVYKCRLLSIKTPSNIRVPQSFSDFCLKNLLFSFVKSLQDLHCIICNEEVFAEFINASSALRSLSIEVNYRYSSYNWKQVETNLNVERLSYVNGDLRSVTIDDIFLTFPNLKSLNLREHVLTHSTRYIFAPSEGLSSNLIELEGDRVLSLSRMRLIRVLNVNINKEYVLSRLTEMLPSLSQLKRLRVRLCCETFYGFDKRTSNIFCRLMEVLKLCKSLEELDFPYILYDPPLEYIKELTSSLPDSVKTLKYGDFILRNFQD
jgi:hypothetical protein